MGIEIKSRLLHRTRLSWGIAHPKDRASPDPRCLWLLMSQVGIDNPDAQRDDVVSVSVPEDLCRKVGLA